MWRALGVTLLVATVGVGASAQVVPGVGAAIGTLSADRARLAQITGGVPDSAARPRAVGALDTTAASPAAWGTVLPTLRIVTNSDLPAGGNDGALWAGRGRNASITGGVWYRRLMGTHLLQAQFAPELMYSQNLPFPLLPGREPGRSTFSSPFHLGLQSADLPLRFGDRPVRAIGPGQSFVSLGFDRVTVGAATTNEWWGPAVRNTLLLSNNAPGIPRLFVQTSKPFATRVGRFEGRAFVGGLSESPFFDRNPTNDVRSANGVLVLWQPAIDTGLTIGLSRLVIASVASPVGVLPHFIDAVLRYEPMRDVDLAAGDSTESIDQLMSLFARWVFPASGFETYVEWARMEVPRSLRDLLVAPQNTQGYTIGLQWTDPTRPAGHLRVQGEVTYLEQTPVILGRPLQDFYAGRAAVQGFTQRGQVLGAATGPGSSSQFVGVDWIAPRWQAGTFVARVRTENDALYRQYPARLTQHDVTMQAGLRGGLRLRDLDVAADLTSAVRYNYLFQSDYYLGTPVLAIDIRNVTLGITLSPR
jgi:hypothetical protein